MSNEIDAYLTRLRQAATHLVWTRGDLNVDLSIANGWLAHDIADAVDEIDELRGRLSRVTAGLPPLVEKSENRIVSPEIVATLSCNDCDASVTIVNSNLDDARGWYGPTPWFCPSHAPQYDTISRSDTTGQS